MAGSEEARYEATEVSASELNALLRTAATPVLVYVWAPWCQPCKTMSPAMNEVAARIGGDVRVVKLNAVAEPHLLTALHVASVPTLLLFSNEGQERARLLGALSAGAVIDWVAARLGSSAIGAMT